VNGGSWLLAVLVLLFTASLINIWNFMDGINGIAASQAVVAMLGLAPVLPWPYSLAAVALEPGMPWIPAVQLPAPGSSWAMSEAVRWGMRSQRLLAIASVRTDISWILLLVPVSPFLVDAGFHCWRASFPDNAGWNPIPSMSTSARCRQEPVTPGDRDVLCFGPVQYYSVQCLLQFAAEVGGCRGDRVVHRAERPLASSAMECATDKVPDLWLHPGGTESSA
jgi:hypothetical protein